ncbi:TfoX/Sxy family protein [Nitrospira sp. CMX1]|jgi:TfoX/Sxy family transcriptional regulator of competence genes
MAFDQDLALRVRRLLEKQDGISERKMFGGLAFLLKGKMFCGVLGGDLVTRLGAEQAQSALKRPHIRPMDFTGRPMKGYVYVAPEGLKTDRALETFLRRAIAYTSSLSEKSSEPKNKRTSGTAKTR